MAFYGWHDCPVETREQINQLSSSFARLLAEQLIGIYLHGSLAMGSFNPHRSDLDLLVVTTDPMSLTIKREIAETLLRLSQQPHPVEISFLAQDQLRPWRYPTPFDLHYSEAWRDRCTHELVSGAWQAWNRAEHHDPDLAAHFTVLNARGICLRGEPVEVIFPPVPADDYRASLAMDIHESLDAIASNPVYTILNCCRTYAYLRGGHIFSKEEGGRWALGMLPAGIRDTVLSALAAYGSDRELPPFQPDALGVFATTMRQHLAPILAYSL
jgi:predicted nucleotidyltransferase